MCVACHSIRQPAPPHRSSSGGKHYPGKDSGGGRAGLYPAGAAPATPWPGAGGGHRGGEDPLAHQDCPDIQKAGELSQNKI